MGVLQALVLFFSGLFTGIIATLFDVLTVGGPSFVSHVALWVLINTLLAVHLENRLHAILWAIPFNLGYVEGYFITTVASYEGYTKSLVAPLAAMAVLAPFLTYAVWTAKNERNSYGRMLSALVVLGTLGMCYAINKHIGVYDGVIAALVALLFVVPTRKLKMSRAQHPVMTPIEEDVAAEGSSPSRRMASPRDGVTPQDDLDKLTPTPRSTLRPTKRSKRPSRAQTNTTSTRRRMEEREMRERAAQRESLARDRSRRRSASKRAADKSAPAAQTSIPTLGHARVGVTRDSLRNS